MYSPYRPPPPPFILPLFVKESTSIHFWQKQQHMQCPMPLNQFKSKIIFTPKNSAPEPHSSPLSGPEDQNCYLLNLKWVPSVEKFSNLGHKILIRNLKTQQTQAFLWLKEPGYPVRGFIFIIVKKSTGYSGHVVLGLKRLCFPPK